MQPRAHTKNTALLQIVFVCSGVAAQPSSNLEVGIRYLDALYAFDYAELEDVFDPDAVFEDPTVVAFAGEAVRVTGRSAIFDFFRQASEGIVDGGFEVLSSFATGQFVVFNLEYWSTFEGELMAVQAKIITIKVPGVTILKFQDGLLIHHTDHVDYELLHEQVAKQSE